MFFKKTDHTFSSLPPTVEERDLMRKLSDDLINVLDRHQKLCHDTYQPKNIVSMQINVLTHILVYYFFQTYKSTNPIIPYMTTFLTSLNDIIQHQSVKDHG